MQTSQRQWTEIEGREMEGETGNAAKKEGRWKGVC